jgi:hypothetical protein
VPIPARVARFGGPLMGLTERTSPGTRRRLHPSPRQDETPRGHLLNRTIPLLTGAGERQGSDPIPPGSWARRGTSSGWRPRAGFANARQDLNMLKGLDEPIDIDIVVVHVDGYPESPCSTTADDLMIGG